MPDQDEEPLPLEPDKFIAASIGRALSPVPGTPPPLVTPLSEAVDHLEWAGLAEGGYDD